MGLMASIQFGSTPAPTTGLNLTSWQPFTPFLFAQDAANLALGPSLGPGAFSPPAFAPCPPGSAPCNVQPIRQRYGNSCGQASVAMAINSVTGSKLTDKDIRKKYGFGLIGALNAECGPAGVHWKHDGNLNKTKWPDIEKAVGQGLPVIVALNGPEFSPSGRGHIVTIVDVKGDKVTYADPATGEIKSTTKDHMNKAKHHPHGNFIFLPERDP
jgi:hypothetical protein